MPATRKFHRKKGQRVAFRQGLAVNLIQRGKITTTVTRAKELKKVVERYITIAKKGELSKFRLLISKLPKKVAEKLYYDIAPKYKDRKGGYTRIVKKASPRKRDGAETATIEFV